MTKLTINGLMDDAEIRWKQIACCCSTIVGDVEHQYPISECKHCKFQEAEDSMPREDFVIEDSTLIEEEEGVSMSTSHEKTVHEITIVRGKKFQEIIGWYY